MYMFLWFVFVVFIVLSIQSWSNLAKKHGWVDAFLAIIYLLAAINTVKFILGR